MSKRRKKNNDGVQKEQGSRFYEDDEDAFALVTPSANTTKRKKRSHFYEEADNAYVLVAPSANYAALKAAWLAGPNVDGSQDIYATVEFLPDGTLRYGGDRADEMEMVMADVRKEMASVTDDPITNKSVVEFLLKGSSYSSRGRVKQVH